MVVIMIPQVLDVYGTRPTARLNDFSVWWHIGGVLVTRLLTAFGQHTQPAAYLHRAAVGRSGGLPVQRRPVHVRLDRAGLRDAALYASGGIGLAFVLGPLQAQDVHRLRRVGASPRRP
jgi:hypothetical protein